MFGIPLGEFVAFIIALAAAGIITGMLAGLFGVGGGAVIVPVLYQVFTTLEVPEAVRMHLCVGSSLAIIIPTSIQSYRTHRAKGATRMDVLKLWAVPVVVGTVLGSVLAAFAPGLLLKAVFVLIAGSNAIKNLVGREDWRLGADFPGPLAMRAYGFGTGFASALMGIGGGAISNMIFSFYGRSIHQAVATSAGIGVLISIPGTLGYIVGGWDQSMPPELLALGYVSLTALLLVAPITTLAAPFGARLAHRMPKRKLEIAFGAFLAIVCARFLYDIVRTLLS
ncbi:MAG: sulfite exporter TauE/SafE family protein [Xanthobacteraceae bacterium]